MVCVVVATTSMSDAFGETGSSVELRVTDYGIVMPPSAELTNAAGTIVFWVNPDFGPEDPGSHTFLSARWSGDDNSYLVISDGWWEPAGAGLLYFVLSNEDHVHCTTAYDLPRGDWSMIAVSWSGGRCEIYVDAVARTSIVTPPPKLRRLTRMTLGADDATTLARRRSAPGRYAHVRVFDVALTAEQVRSLFDRDHLAGVTSGDADWRWLDRDLADNPRARASSAVARRAIFDEGHHWGESRAETDKRLERISRAGFNIYVPTIWYGGGTYYPSRLVPRDPVAAAMQRTDDPVAYLIQRAHDRDIEVHGSFTIAKRAENGLATFFGPGVPPMAYDVHNPQFRDFIVGVVAEAAERYKLDGINLDYIRAIGICTSPSCRRAYAAATGRNLAADYLVRFTSEAAGQSIALWQRKAIHDIVSRIRARLEQLDRSVTLSVCFNSIEDTPYSLEGRDASGWIDAGLVDIAFDMQYTKRIDVQRIDNFRRQLSVPDRHIVLLANWDRDGDAVTPRTAGRLGQLAEFSSRHWPSGFALYLYNQLDDAQIEMLRPLLAPSGNSRPPGDLPGP